MKSTIALAFVLALPASAVRAEHHEHGKHEKGMKEGRGPKGPRSPEAHMKEKLGLDDAQAAKVKQAFEGHKAAMEPLRRQLRDAMTRLGDQVQDKASDNDIKGSLGQLDTVQKQIQAEREKLKNALSSILTPLQQAKFVLGMRGGMGGMTMGGPGPQGRGPGARPGRPTKDRHDDHDHKDGDAGEGEGTDGSGR